MIAEGTDALNRFISSGEIEELKDVIPPPSPTDDDDDGDDDSSEPDNKRPKRIVNHNAQIIYNKLDGNMNNNLGNHQAGIPSLMTLNLQVDVPVMPNMNDDEDFRITNPTWNQSNDWGAPPQSFNQAAANNNQPPSLLNIQVAPPFNDSNEWKGSSRSGRSSSSKSEGTKRRNRDSEGNRISRFDREGPRPSRFENNEGGSSRSRRSGGSNKRNSERNSSGRSSNRRI